MGTTNISNGITKEMYKNGWTFFVIPLTATLDDSDCFELIRNSTTTLQLKFTEPIDDKKDGSGVQLIIIGEFDQVIAVDNTRRVITDLAV